MKQKSFLKKLVLSKTTVSILNGGELNNANGGAVYTDAELCYTRYKDQCMSVDPRYCPTYQAFCLTRYCA